MGDGSDFWRFSLSFYGEEQVAEACLRLQDEAGADVNMLLFLLWRARQGRRLSAGEIAALDAAVSGWRAEVVVPLRSVRRWLKGHAGPVQPDEAEKLRREVKGIELEGERLQQAAMAALAEIAAPGKAAGSPDEAAMASLAAYEEFRGRALPQGPVKVLLGSLARCDTASRLGAGGKGGV
ncbi:MAG TPA: TIGR02444 family protein [Afifellaceae bacterium]|nr:TIGR02444 family protein [Afifellaceae bacterium]